MPAIYWSDSLEQHYIGHQMAEIYREKIYAPFFQAPQRVVLDVGAHLGLFSLWAADKSKKVYAIEPTPRFVEAARKTMQSNEIINVEFHKIAISLEDGVTDFYENKENCTMNSLTPFDFAKSFRVKTMRLDTFFEKNNIKKVDFMKLDIEGAEAEVLGGEGFANVASRIKQFVVELHSWSNRNPQQILTSIIDRGFEIRQIPNDAQLFYAWRKSA